MGWPQWTGVFPALTTQLNEDESLNIDATLRHAEYMIDCGVDGLILLGSLGENQALEASEKRELIKAAVDAFSQRVPVLSGVAETSTAAACRYVSDLEKLGASGFMVMPAMVYKTTDKEESLVHLEAVRQATSLPIMIYNNPISYGNDLGIEELLRLAECPQYVAIKESSGDPRRIPDIRNALGTRFRLFAGVDDLILESAVLGIDGWVAGLGIAFPKENQYFWNLCQSGRFAEARTFYQWFTPLLHLDVNMKFVQFIKLAVQECGLGREWVRAPRRVLHGRERQAVLEIIHRGIASRPVLNEGG